MLRTETASRGPVGWGERGRSGDV